MTSVSEIELRHDRESILSADCQGGVIAVLYHSGEVFAQGVDDDKEKKRIEFFNNWVKNPYKVFVHPVGHYIIVSSTDGLLHFFSSQESSLRCTVELTTSDLRHRIFVAESICWLPRPAENVRRAPLEVLVGTTSMGLCFNVSFEFLSRSIKPCCAVLTTLPFSSKHHPSSVNGIFYTNYGARHILVMSTPMKLFYVTAMKSESENLSQFLDDVKDHKWEVETWASSSSSGASSSGGGGPTAVSSSSFKSGVASTGPAFRVFSPNEWTPRSFCWVSSSGEVLHGLFDEPKTLAAVPSPGEEKKTDDWSSNSSAPFCQKVEYVEMNTVNALAAGPRQAAMKNPWTSLPASSAASPTASAKSSSSSSSSVSSKVQAVIPTSSHMVFLLDNQCVAVQHPAGIPWKPPVASTVTLKESKQLLDWREVLDHAMFDSARDSTLSDEPVKGILYDSHLRRIFVRSTDTIWEVVLQEDRHQLWDLFIHRAANADETEPHRIRYFSAARRVAKTEEEKNTTEFLLGFFFIANNRLDEGTQCLARCDWFEDIFMRLKENPSVCEKFLEKRFMLLASAYQEAGPTSPDAPKLESALQGIVHTVVWWKCKITTSSVEKKSGDETGGSTKAIDSFVDLAYSLVPSLFDRSGFCEHLVNLMRSFELKGDSCITLYMKIKDYGSVMSYFIEHDQIQRAVQTLADCDPRVENFRLLWCQFLPKIIPHAPVAVLGTLRRFLAKAHRQGIMIDIDGLLPAFFLYKVEQNETMNSQPVNQVKLLLNSAIYKYNNDSEVIHNYYLYLLAEEGDEERLQLHLEHSQKYDICYAVQCCLEHQYADSIKILHKRLGFFSDLVMTQLQQSSQAIKDDPEVKEWANSQLDEAQLKWMWRSVLLHTLENQNTSEALKVVEHSQGAITLEDLLQCVKDDNAAVETLKDSICQQLDHLSSLCIHHAKQYTTTLQAVGISKYQLHEVQQQVSHISSTQKCALCRASLLGKTSQYEPYLVYPTCKHAVHEICAVKKLKDIGSIEVINRSLDVRGPVTYENLAAADCVICGEAAILELGIPMV